MSESPKWLAHIVYFALKDTSPQAVARLVEACRKHLAGHPGERLFVVGQRTPDLNREVNDKEFEVALNVVFESRQAHDDYQSSPRHLQFIAENRENWKSVRVFDADVAPA